MVNRKVILVFGANGNLGRYFVGKALAANYKVKAFVRNSASFDLTTEENLEVVEGDATLYKDVEKAVTGADLILSCLGNPKGKEIMYNAHSNVLNAARKQQQIPRCLFISSIGCGGTSWIIKQMLSLIGGKASFDDYESADQLIDQETEVPFLLVRPYALTDKKELGTYHVSKKQNGTFLKPITRADVANFLLHAVSDQQWDGSPGVLIGGAKS